jgi:hypothetical protein
MPSFLRRYKLLQMWNLLVACRLSRTGTVRVDGPMRPTGIGGRCPGCHNCLYGWQESQTLVLLSYIIHAALVYVYSSDAKNPVLVTAYSAMHAALSFSTNLHMVFTIQ